MSIVRCIACSSPWDAQVAPTCPACQAREWEQTPGFIRPKHDPGVLPSGYPYYRSVLTNEFVADPQPFLEYAAASGTWYFSERHGDYCHVTCTPLGAIPGSGVQPGKTLPDHALDGLVVAGLGAVAHAYATDTVRFIAELHGVALSALGRCGLASCNNLAIPGVTECVVHVTPPRAR
jgi:hypothetical protein